MDTPKTLSFSDHIKGVTARHEWKFDHPWEVVRPKDWFYYIGAGQICGIAFLHVRFLGVRSMWSLSNNTEVRE